jgi:Hint domain
MSTISSTISQAITLGTPGYLSPLTIIAGGAVIPGGAADAIYGSSGSAGTVVNAGSIVATGAHAGIDLKGGGTLTNSGYIYGGTAGVYAAPFGYGTDTVTNLGTVASGGAGVTISGNAMLVNGASTATGAVISGATAVAFGHNYQKELINYGTIVGTGASGLGVYVGGGFGIDGGDVFNHGTIIGAGGTAVAFGAASNGANLLIVYPGAGFGGVANGGGKASLTFGSAHSVGTITSLASEYVGFPSIEFGARSSWVLPGNQTVASGTEITGGDGTLAASGTLTNAGIINVGFSGETFTESGTLINNGTLSGMTLIAGGYLANQTGAVADSVLTTPGVSIANAGTLIAPRLNGASLTNSVGGYATEVRSYGTVPSFVVNAGTMVGTGTGRYGAGVRLDQGGTVINGATSNTSALITGSYGVNFGRAFGAPPAAVTNYGTILGLGESESGYGVAFGEDGGTLTNGAANDTVAQIGGYYYGVAGVTVLANFGTITETSTLRYRAAVQPDRYHSGVITNGASNDSSALISGNAGILFRGGSIAQTIVNFGTIQATGTGTTSFGVYLDAGGTIINRAGGLIESNAIGIDLYGTIGATIINDGTIRGVVGIRDTTDDTMNTIITNGTIIGSSGTAIAFGCDADVIVLGTTAVISGALVGFQSVDTIDLAGVVADSVTFSGGALTISSGGTAVQTLAFAGQFKTSDFELSPDGSEGTNVTLSQPTGHVLSGSYDHTLLLTNPTQQNPMTLTSTATLVASAGDGVLGASGTDWTLTNAGTIGALSSLPCADGVELASLGTMLNAGSIFASGTYGHGVTLAGGGFVSNDSPSALISGYLAGIYASTSAAVATVLNAGTIMATGTSINYTRYRAYAIFLGSGGSVSNSGLVTGYYGVRERGTGIVTNTGTILGVSEAAVDAKVVVNGTNGVTNALIGGYDGVFASTLTNFATIAGTGTRFSYGLKGAGATVINFGTITSAGTYSTTSRDEAAGIAMAGTLTNGATNATNALISGYTGLLGVYGAATVFNLATIAATGTAGDADGMRLRQDGAVTNGAIADTVALITGYTGIYVPSGRYGSVNTAQVTNLATIVGAGTYGYGVLIDGATSAPSSVINGSTADTAALITGYAGVDLGGIGTVRNLGTIVGTGGDGLELPGTANAANGATNMTTALLQGRIGAEIGAGDTLVNFATIEGTGTSSTGVKLHGSSVTNQATGLIIGAYGIGGVGSASTVFNFGTVIGQGGTDAEGVYLDKGGFVSNAADGTIANLSTISTYAAVGAYGATATLINAGLITAANGPGVFIGHGGTVVASAGVIGGTTDAMYFYHGYANRLIVDQGAMFAGAVDGGNTIGATAVSTLELASSASAGTLSGVGTEFINFGQTTIDAGAAWTLLLPNPAAMQGSVSGFAAGDALDLAGIDPASVSLSSGTLDFSGGFFPLALSGAANVQAVTDNAGGALVTVACFREGTRIATPDGEVPVEALKVGDCVRLARGGEARIEWLGHRRINCARHPRPEAVWPVRIAAGTFGERLPCRDLWLSPNHAVLIDDVLVPVKHLIDGEWIVQVPMESVEYWHVELARHDVLLAGGLPSESYLDTGDRASFDNGVMVRLVPEFRADDAAMREWEARACAPLVVLAPKARHCA